MLTVSINRIGFIAPGLQNWAQCDAVLKGEATYVKADVGKFTPNLLRPNERRRTTNLIKLAMQVGEQIINDCPCPSNQLAAVFTSSEGDTEIVDKICAALTLPDQPVSPTQFHNSVHNAPAGYWAIATECRESSTSLSSGKASFASGLLEASTTAVAEQKPVLMISYDYPAPESLHPFVGITEPLACAMLITHDDSLPKLASVSLEISQDGTMTEMNIPELEALRLANPSGNCLPVLNALANQDHSAVNIPYVAGNTLKVTLI